MKLFTNLFLAPFALTLAVGCELPPPQAEPAVPTSGSATLTTVATAPSGLAAAFMDPASRSEAKQRYLAHARTGVTSTGYDLRAQVGEQFTNGGFETGDFTGWIAIDNGLPGLNPWAVCEANQCGFFGNSEPVEGQFDALNGFDGEAGYQAFLSQDISVPENGGVLSLADRIQFDSLGIPSFLPRVYELQIRDQDGDLLEVLHHEEILLNGQPFTDLGWRLRSFDLSQYGGQTVQLRADLFVPETFTGPAQFEIDNVQFTPAVDPVTCVVNLNPSSDPLLNNDPFVLTVNLDYVADARDVTVEVVKFTTDEAEQVYIDQGVPMSPGFAIEGFPVFSTLAFTAQSETVGFFASISDADTGKELCADKIVLDVQP